MMKLRSFVWDWLPVLAWMGIIFAASSDMMSAAQTSRFIGPFLRWLAPEITPETIGAVQFFVRKAAHVTEYAILGALLARAFLRGRGKTATRHALFIWLTAVAWAAVDEFHQSFIASRTGSPVDVMIDAMGALVGVTLYRWLVRSRPT